MQLIDFATYLVYVATYIVVLPVCVAVYFYAYQPKELKILLAGLCLALFFDILLFFYPALKNTFLYIFTAVDILTMSWLFFATVRNTQAQKIILAICILFIPCILLDALIWSGLMANGYTNSIERILIIFLSLYYLTLLFNDDQVIDLVKQPMFWISIGLLLYNLIGLFDFFNKPVLSYSQTLYLQYYIIWSVAAVFMYGCFAYAFWLGKLNERQ